MKDCPPSYTHPEYNTQLISLCQMIAEQEEYKLFTDTLVTDILYNEL